MTTIENLYPGQTIKLANGTVKELRAWHTFRGLGGAWIASLRFVDGDEINVRADASVEVV